MKYDYTDWYLKHKDLKTEEKYSGTARTFIPNYPLENKPKFIPDKLLHPKHLTQR